MPTKFFTNSHDNSLLKKFEGTLTNITSLKNFDALVGYFRASGYFKIRPFLQDIPKIRILVGINVDRLTKKYQEKGQLYLQNPKETKDTFLSEVSEDIQTAEYKNEIEKGLFQFIQDLIDEKIEMRAHPTKIIHAKVYIFRPAFFNEYAPCEVITGSSNLTNAGLGANIDSNYEFNVALRDYEDVKFATLEFEQLWEQSEPILKEEAEKLKKGTFLRDNFTPYEIYIKMLIEYFGRRVEYDPYNIDLLLPPKYIRLKYQSDAANQGYAIMMKHNGSILADVVGLGKTIVACMIMKKFIYENGTHSRILVVVPPAIEKAWRTTIKDFELDIHFSFITIGSLHKILNKENLNQYNPDDFDLIVVDESHKFRNDYTEMYVQLQEICKTPRKRPAENGDTRKKIILISATPLNNRPEDIENQLYLFQDKRNSTLENVRNLQAYFKPKNEKYKKLAFELKNKNLTKTQFKSIITKLKFLFQQLRDDVIEPLVIRRTRADIENNEEYLQDLKTQNIKFPKIGDPIDLNYILDKNLSILFYETVSLLTSIDENENETDGLGYYRYRAIEFLTDKVFAKATYGNVGQISNRLSAIMKTLLIKRLESSFFAFKMSLGRLQKAINNMLEMFENDRVFIAPDLNINKLLEEGNNYDDIELLINKKGGNNKEYQANEFDDIFITYLKEDKAYIDDLVERWNKVKEDPKIEEFTDKINNVFFDKKKNISGKLVIFSESKETAEELSENLKKITKKGILTISAANRKESETTLTENFDANIDEDKWEYDYDIIITTEVLAEGINLHRSNVVVNYDIPWNATRLMQRIGRINRIGTRADNIYVYNFYPSAQGDKQISLVNNALRKLQAFHTAFGEDNKIFSILEEKGESALFGSKIQKEESEILKYLIELREFKKKHPKKFLEYQKIQNKARCGRLADVSLQPTLFNNDNNEITYPLIDTSLTYLKSDNHPGVFCLATPELQIIELNFLQAIKIFKATQKEKSIKLHKLHHKQTLSAMKFFKSEKNQDDLQNFTKKNLSPAENKALTNLNFVIKHAPTEQKKSALRRALDMIKKGTFTSKGLPKSINVFFASNIDILKEPHKFIDLLFIQILDKFDFSSNIEQVKKYDSSNFGIINPKIVLTQSFK